MIVAANDLRNAHIMVVDDNSQHIGRRAVRTQQHKIINILIWKNDPALHGVFDDGFAAQGRFDAHNWRNAFWRLACVSIAPAAVITGRTLFCAR